MFFFSPFIFHTPNITDIYPPLLLPYYYLDSMLSCWPTLTRRYFYRIGLYYSTIPFINLLWRSLWNNVSHGVHNQERGKIKATKNPIRGQVSAMVEYILQLAEKKYPITNNRMAPFLDQSATFLRSRRLFGNELHVWRVLDRWTDGTAIKGGVA